MAAYIVMKGPEPDKEDTVVFIRDGFTWLAFLVPVFWLLWHRLWIEAALALAATVLLSGLGEWAGLGVHASLLSLLVSLFFGLEAASLRARALGRRGWREWGAIEAARRADAELVYADATGTDTEEPEAVSPPQPVARPFSRPVAASQSFGLVPYSGR